MTSNELTQLSPEQIGWVLLKNLKENMPQEYSGGTSRASDTVQFDNAVKGLIPDNLSGDDNRESVKCLAEGWQWLELAALIAPHPTQSQSTSFKMITRRGLSIDTEAELFDFTKLRILPETLIHPDILLDARSQFLLGDYETAIFKAFKKVEIRVRSIGGYEDSKLGVSLMREAFNPQNGPLRNEQLVMAEREAEANLFSGAIGLFKNPPSHRDTGYTAEESVQLLMFASKLLAIIDERTPLIGK